MSALLKHCCVHTVGPRTATDRRSSAKGAERHSTASSCRLPNPRKSARLPPASPVVKAADTQQAESEAEVQIEGIDRNYCDEFECTSSPAVERNLRALARDITRVSRWTLSFFASDVEYKVHLFAFLDGATDGT